LKEAQPFLSTAQIQEMHAAGFTFGGHSVSHRKFVQLPVERVEAEIVESCKKIQAITGEEEVPFAFPNSATGFDRKLLRKIREENDVVGLIFNSKGLLPDEPYLFNRIWMERKLKNGKRTWQAYLKDAYEEFAWDRILKWNK
jgi:peptidoglycan/xylan/chitin deacetylase (PgdA/CDA1 family)